MNWRCVLSGSNDSSPLMVVPRSEYAIGADLYYIADIALINIRGDSTMKTVGQTLQQAECDTSQPRLESHWQQMILGWTVLTK